MAATRRANPVDRPRDPPAVQAAHQAGLHYVTDELPGITRRRRGRGFGYVDETGAAITDSDTRARIASLAIPPAWTEVWISPDPLGHLLATGRDDRGRKQYLYHPRWREVRDGHKFGQLFDFGTGLPPLRATVEADLARRRFSRKKVLALVVRLLDETLIRVGNPEYAVANESYGLTTLQPEHVEVDGSEIEFDFVAKGGLARHLTVDDRRLADLVRQCHELGGQELFSYLGPDGEPVPITSTDVNDFLRQQTKAEVTAKTFRTWGATTAAAAALAITPLPETKAGVEAAVLSAYDVAAAILGNTRAMARASYVHPVIPETYRSGELHDAWKRVRDVGWLERRERAVLRLLEAHQASTV